MTFLKSIWGRLIALLFEKIETNRAKVFVEKFSQFLIPGEKFLDLGCGTGHVGKYVYLNNDQKVTLVDVCPKWGYVGEWLFGMPCAKALANQHGLPYTVYDGLKLPFDDGEFDTVALIAVLHHASNSGAVLAEATRVARRQLIILEDTPNTKTEKRLNRIWDILSNLEFGNHFHRNRTIIEWGILFRSHELELVHVESWICKMISIPIFFLTLFVLKK